MPVTSTFQLMTSLVPSFFTCLVAASAVAAPRPDSQVAIASLEFEGTLPGAARTALLERLAEGLKTGDLTLRGDARAARDKACTDSACYRDLARKLDVSYLVAGKVSENQKNYEIELELITGATGRSSGNHRQRCQICGLSEAAERMSLAASALTEKLKMLMREPGRLMVRARPTNTVVIVDGVVKGRVPQEVNLPAGRHKLQLEAQGFRPVEREVEIVPSVDQAMEIDMMAIPSEFPYRTAGWVAVTTGAALVAAGVVTMVAFHGTEVTCDVPNERGICPNLYRNGWLGAGFFAAGAAAGALGGFWLYLGGRQGDAATSVTSMNVGWQGRF